MEFNVYIPKTKYASVELVWEMKFNKNELPNPQYVPPLGSPEIIFYVNGNQLIAQTEIKSVVIKGQYTFPQKISMKSGAHIIGFRLKPYSLLSVFKINCANLKNSVADGTNFELLRTSLEKLTNGKDNLQVILSELIMMFETVNDQGAIHPCIYDLFESSNLHTDFDLNYFLSKHSISLRHFQRLFLKSVGINFREYCGIMRMIKIESLIQSNNDWLEIVEKMNFVDQSHLIKEIKKLRKTTPTKLVKSNLILSAQLPKPQQHFI